jgi:hypothetical protein
MGKNNIKTGLQRATLKCAGRMHVAQDGDHWSAVVDIIVIPQAQ